jgi:hypothetical protein
MYGSEHDYTVLPAGMPGQYAAQGTYEKMSQYASVSAEAAAYMGQGFS